MKFRKSKDPPPLPLTNEQVDLMGEIIHANGERLRKCFGKSPYDNIEGTATFYSGVAAGIGISILWFQGKGKGTDT